MKLYWLFGAAHFLIFGNLFAQGSVIMDNSVVSNRVSIDVPLNPYSGAYGMEVWQSGNTNSSLSGALDLTAMTNSQAAYDLLISSGFRLEHTFAAQTMAQGVFELYINMPGVDPPGSTVTLALVAWNSSAASWSAAVAGGAKGGLIAFMQPTANYAMATPPLPPDLNWTIPQDLVMMTIVPEPGTAGLFFVAASVLLTVHWRDKLFRGGSRLRR